MKDGFLNKCYQATLITLLLTLISLNSARADKAGWKRKEVNWRLSGGSKIKAIYYPEDKPPLLSKRAKAKPRIRQEIILPETTTEEKITIQQLPVIANIIDSPPIGGFVPWIVVSVTDSDIPGESSEFSPSPVTAVTGNYLASSPQSDYAIGIFDTGASTSLISYSDAYTTGIDPDYLTSFQQILQGISGQTATAYSSHPLGIFVDGIDAIEPDGLLIDTSGMVGETNVSIIAGDSIESPNLPTAIGAPLAIYFSAAFCNNKETFISIDGSDFNSPDIDFYNPSDPCVPYYNNKINLKLLPADVDSVQYFPCIPGLFECGSEEYLPVYSTLIVDFWWTHQGLFFVSFVDLQHGNNTATQMETFMFDTGAQVTVISDTVRSRLGLNPNDPNFTVDILDVTGTVIHADGFYVDSLKITASPEYLSYEKVPVIVLDLQVPGLGYIDGIIGMNLFVDLNFVFTGGGLIGMDAPFIRYEPACRIPGDIAGDCYQCKVDFQDLVALTQAWLATESPRTENWNPNADMAPLPTPDGLVNLRDYAVLAEHWLETAEP